MCGIAAVLLHPQARSAQAWRDIRETFTRCLVANSARGRSATGVAIVSRDGSSIVHKLGFEASEFVQTDGYRDLLELLDEGIVLILGHARWPTQGSPDNPYNNHPIEVDDVIGVHNGHIANDGELFAQWQLPRRAQVDSEIIFRRLAALSPLELDRGYRSAVAASLSQLRGPCTFLAIDRRRPTQLLAYKHENPLCLHFQRDWQALFFSSEYRFLRQTFGPCVSQQSLSRDHLVCFDALRLPELSE